MSLPIHYSGDVVDGLAGRVFGPDTAGGYVVVEHAEFDPDKLLTTAQCRPVLLDELERVRPDWFGQLVLACCVGHHDQRPEDPEPSGRPITGDGGVMARCCDPDDCGPCCPECPTCPSIPREAR